MGGATAAPAPVPLEPAALVAAVEQRLLDSPVRLRYRVTAEGAFSADIDGVVRMAVDSTRITGDGSFGGADVALRLDASDDSVRVGSPRGESASPTPGRLREAVAIGLVRMGVLHNLARLTAGALPDHAEGGVGEWVVLHGVERDSSAAPEPNRVGVRFEIHVSGTHTADAVLWIDASTLLPVRREQIVRFPGGSMTVVEHFEPEG
jgi:hypothetical protein